MTRPRTWLMGCESMATWYPGWSSGDSSLDAEIFPHHPRRPVGGHVVLLPQPSAPVTVIYNPTSYTTPTNYAVNFTGTGGPVTSLMLVYPDGLDTSAMVKPKARAGAPPTSR